MSRGRRRDRLVYLAARPALFALVSATRGRPVRRLGRTVLVHGPDAYVEALTRIPLDRTAPGTTGGIARAAAADGSGVVFDESGPAHRNTRRTVAAAIGATAVDRLAPVWREVLARRLAPLRAGGRAEVVDVALELTGATAAALLGVGTDPLALARTARAAAAAAAHANLPGLARLARPTRLARLPGLTGATADPAADLIGLVGSARGAMLAVAAVNTMVAALPRAVAWCALDGLWPYAADRHAGLVDELLRVLAPTPLLPRVAAADGTVDGYPVHAGDRLILVTRHAVGAHRTGPDPDAPVAARRAQLVFGAGPHACPGAALARAQLADALAAFAPYRPELTLSRVDRRSALPGWSTVVVRAGRRDDRGEPSVPGHGSPSTMIGGHA